MGLAWKPTLLSMVGVCVVGCATQDTYDASEPALNGVRSALRSADADLERASDLSFFRGSLNAYSADPRLPPPLYENGLWTFDYPGRSTIVSFASADGMPVSDPDEQTAAMTIELAESIDFFVGYPVQSTATVRSETFDPGSYTPSIVVSRVDENELEVQQDEVTGRSGRRIEANASAVVVDRGDGVVPRYCPEGEVRGVSKAWGSTDAPDGLGERYGETELDFEAHFEGRELVWQAFEGDTLVDEGRTLTTFAQGC